MDSLAQDTLLGARYRLARRIAIGGMGEVWRAEDAVLGRTVAVKVLKSEFTSDPTFLERFRTEARTTASLSHPGIANVHDYGEVTGPDQIPVAYLVMEYVDGEPLSAQLARDGRLPAARVLEVVRQAALALSEAHRVGMVHRDVKPGNLLVRRSDGAVKITDFGIARAADAVPLTQNGMVVGTAQYFSPEQAEGRVVGPASDVYSLGVVAYECLAGRLPFVADSPVAVAMMQIRDTPPPLPADVPAPVRSLVLRALAKDPRQRFAGGGELAEAVRAVQEGRYDAGGAPAGSFGAPLIAAPVVPGPAPLQPDGVGGTNPSLAYPPPWAAPPASGPPRFAPGPGAHAEPPPSGTQSGYPGLGAHPEPPPSSTPGYPGPAPHADPPPPSGAQPGYPGLGAHPEPPPSSTPGYPGPAPHADPPPPGGTQPGYPGPAPARLRGRREPARRRPSRWPLWIAAGLLLALALVGAAIVLLSDPSAPGGDDRPDRSAALERLSRTIDDGRLRVR